MPKKFKITNAGSAKDSPQLVDCWIEQTATGYELVAKRMVLATSTSTTPPFTFTTFNYGVGGPIYSWDLSASSISTDGDTLTGTWSNDDTNPEVPDPDGESGSWTAQAGSGADDDAESATSATA